VACEAARIILRHDAGGNVRPEGRSRRAVSLTLRRALERRDGGCRFPGCANRICDAHHVVHWADGGRTRLDNLVLLCRRHHRAVHEDGFGVCLPPGGEPGFSWPDGTPLPDAPRLPPLGVDPVTRLAESQQFLAIDSWTPTPRWNGERFDLDYTVRILQQWRRRRWRKR
jgi:hypothetical protein